MNDGVVSNGRVIVDAGDGCRYRDLGMAIGRMRLLAVKRCFVHAKLAKRYFSEADGVDGPCWTAPAEGH